MGCLLSKVVQKEGYQFCNIILLKSFFFTFNILENEKIWFEKRKLLHWFKRMGSDSNFEIYNAKRQINSSG